MKSSLYRANPNDGVAWVTGASSGIGYHTVLELVNRGYTVAVTSRNVDKLKELFVNNNKVKIYDGDVTEIKTITSIVNSIETECGPIVLAFLNAGAHFRNRKELFGDDFQKTFNVNYFGTVNCLQILVPIMFKRQKGQIVVMSSVSGYGGLPYFGEDYISSKAALISLCESIKTLLEKRNIRLQLVCPAFVNTNLVSSKIHTPFMVRPEKAASIICNGMQVKGFEISFPRSIVYLLKIVNMLPYSVYFFITEKIMKWLKK